jgi:hypothetical protein
MCSCMLKIHDTLTKFDVKFMIDVIEKRRRGCKDVVSRHHMTSASFAHDLKFGAGVWGIESDRYPGNQERTISPKRMLSRAIFQVNCDAESEKQPSNGLRDVENWKCEDAERYTAYVFYDQLLDLVVSSHNRVKINNKNRSVKMA